MVAIPQVQRSPLLQMLMSRRPAPAVAGPIGAVARGARGLLAGMMARDEMERTERDRTNRAAAMQAMAQGMMPQPFDVPDEEQGPGGYAGGISALQTMGDNPYAGELAGKLAMAQATQQAEMAQQAELQRAKTEAAKNLQASKAAAAVDLAKAKRGEGPFSGTGMTAQAFNVLVGAQEGKIDPASPAYAAAYAHLSKPQTMFDPELGQMVQRPGADLSAFPMPGKPASQATPGVTKTPYRAPKMSQAQSKAASYADRIKAANETIRKYEEEGQSAWNRMAEGVPGGNYAVSPEFQMLEQAERDFVNAQLREESGAVINPEEFENAKKQYFPRPGDTKEVIEQKRKARERALKSMERSAGPGYGKQPEMRRIP